MKKVILIICFFILLSCNYSEKKKTQPKKNDINTEKISLNELLKPRNIDNLIEGNLSNIDNLNGFRGLKFNLNVNRIDKSTLRFENLFTKDYSSINEIIDNGEKINNTEINIIKIEFYKDTLKSIILELNTSINREVYVKYHPTVSKEKFDFTSWDLLEFYIRSFGKPNQVNIINFFKKTPYNNDLESALHDFKEYEDTRTGLYLEVIWETNKIAYKLRITGNGGVSKINKEIYDFSAYINIYEKKYKKLLYDAEKNVKDKKAPQKNIKNL
jgi:hypothetical protein